MRIELPNGTKLLSETQILDAIDRREPDINSLVYLDQDATQNIDDETSAGYPVVFVKDNIAVRGAPWACGSATRMDQSATRDSAVVTLLRQAGATILGTTNMDEFAMGASTETSAWGPTRNPWDAARSAGGSSGGSAAAAAAYGALAVGTDTGGSIREPAAQCGVVGVKPTHGQISVDGVVPFAPSLDTVGPLAPTVSSAAWLHDVMASSGKAMTRAAEAGARKQRLDSTIGVVSEMSTDHNSPEIIEALDRTIRELTDMGANVVTVSLPSAVVALNTYFVLSSVEALPVLEHHAQIGALGIEAQYRLDQGRALVDTPAWQDALIDRDRITSELEQLFADCDILLTPTMPLVAPPLKRADLDDPLLIPRTDWWTVEANLAGIPAMSFSAGVGRDSGLPVGMQLMAPKHHDADLYFTAATLPHTH